VVQTGTARSIGLYFKPINSHYTLSSKQ